ncbi:MAG: Peroxidase [uncultured Thiotrichaceae bacterium]|uniref:Peroxidase n=1 Tax=uncultured Thiotrichaceae bacterium TaxID=298394 RepID=A0A6S6TWY8_9GAMM|nr:MAG: Peroxidase [uncultured Thiotrichaceae bacterium]
MNAQQGIIEEIPTLSRYQFYRMLPDASPLAAITMLATFAAKENIVIGFGQSLLHFLDVSVPSMRNMPEFEGKGIDVPTTPFALWCWIRGDDRGELLHKARMVRQTLADSFVVDKVVDAFSYKKNKDLTGYEDGTENPEGEDALKAAFTKSDIDGLGGSSFVAVQQWMHDLDAFDALTPQQQDHTFGRDRISNEELDDAPESAHVKRAEQENFDPPAFMLRRSMPWADGDSEGLVFVSFGCSFDAFEAVMQRMVGYDDGVKDALFTISHPVTGSYFWCPPVHEGEIDLRLLSKQNI